MLDLKAKLAAAGVVTKEQVDEFDQKQAEAQRQKQEQAEARRKNNQRGKGQGAERGKGHKGQGGKGQGANGQRGKAQRATGQRGKGPAERPAVNVQALKQLGKGEAYERIRKIVARQRLDDGERTIPGPEDKAFNFVTFKGRIGKLYLKDATIEQLRAGSAAISSFMSHHGLAHCVLPKDIALSLAEVFPLWLRHLRDHPAAGLLEEAEPSDTPGDTPSDVPNDAPSDAPSDTPSE